jgi:uncharacterized membrane protein
MARLFSIRPTLTLKGRRFMGIRGWAGKPTHPPLTDIPIGAYVIAAVCDVVSVIASGNAPEGGIDPAAHDFFIAGTIVMTIGFAGGLAAATTGFFDWWKGLPRDRKSGGAIGRAQHTQVWRTTNWHAVVMLTVTAIVAIDLIVRYSQLNDGEASLIVAILSVVAAGLVAFGAAFGGALVYEYQFNVQDISRSTAWDETEEDQFPGRKRATTD